MLVSICKYVRPLALAPLMFACGSEGPSAPATDPALPEAESAEATDNPLTVESHSMWKPAVPAIEFTGIALCFEGKYADEAQYATFRAGVMDAAREWEKATDNYVRFGTIGKCGRGVKIRLKNLDDAGGNVDDVGFTTELNVHSDYKDNRNAVKEIALHELGHVLGFTHEQTHSDSTCDQHQRGWWIFGGETVGQDFFEYDPQSIMNYCATLGPNLSASDIDIVQRMYGGADYFLSDGRAYWFRSDLGYFMRDHMGMNQSMFNERFTFKNVTKPGQDISYGDEVTIQNSRGQYISAASASNRRTNTTSYSVSLGSTATRWLTSSPHSAAAPFAAFHSGKINVNKPVGFSTMLGGQRVYLTASKNPKNGFQSVGVSRRTEDHPPQKQEFIWRTLGPGPDTDAAEICDLNNPRCGDSCCGSTCKDASISLCCGMFNQVCGDTCCGLDETCDNGTCRIETVEPPPPGQNCGAFPSCSLSSDCGANWDYCNGAGCCRRI